MITFPLTTSNASFMNKPTLNFAVRLQTPLLAGRKIMKIIVFFIFISILSTLALGHESVLYQEVFKYHNDTAMEREYAYEVVDKIFNAFEQWFFTVTFCNFTYFENRILKYIETKGNGYPALLLNGCPDINKSKVKPIMTKHGQTAYLVTSGELSLDVSGFAIDAFRRTGYFKPGSTVIFIITSTLETDEYFYYELKQHFQLLWSRGITNSVLILKANSLKIYNYNPFIDKVCDLTETKNIDDVLIQQYHNLYGYNLRLSVFRKFYITNETGPVLCNSKLANIVISFLNASCIPLAPRDGSTVGDLLDNGTATGVTADLMDGYTDLELSSRILKDSFYGYIDTTYPLKQDELCFLVKNSEKQSTFTTTIMLISVPLFFGFVFIVIVFIMLSIIVHKAESSLIGLNSKQTAGVIALDLIMCFVRQTVNIKFWGPVYRIVIATIVIYSLIVNCVIDGIMFSAIRSPRFRPNIATMTELLESNLTLGIHNRDKKLFFKSLNDEQSKALENRIEIFDDKKIKEVIEKRQFQYAVLMKKTDAVYISKKISNLYNGRSLFYVMDDCPVPCSIVYGLRYGSPYLSRINYILDHLNQGGILDRWLETEEYSLQNKLSTTSKETRPLDISTLQEVFIVQLIGMLICVIVFVLEVILYSSHRHLQKHLRRIGMSFDIAK